MTWISVSFSWVVVHCPSLRVRQLGDRLGERPVGTSRENAQRVMCSHEDLRKPDKEKACLYKSAYDSMGVRSPPKKQDELGAQLVRASIMRKLLIATHNQGKVA